MKLLFIKYKAVVKFIFIFLSMYILLSVIYKFYLQCSDGLTFYPDYMTHLVSVQSKALLEFFGYNVAVFSHPEELSIKVLLNGVFIARVVEGCNSISVIILFISFVIAFSRGVKVTLLYILLGSICIYSINLFRIVALILGLYHYSEYAEVLHTIVFPIAIYGIVFLLWVFWVNGFSKLKGENA